VFALVWMQACSRAVDQPAPTRLTLGTVPYLTFAPIFIARDEGYFEEQNLRIDFVRAVRGAEMLPPLAAGQLDVLGSAISSSFLNAVTRQANIRFVASKGHIGATGCVANALMARRALIDAGQLSRDSQLKGRRIAMTRGSYPRYYLFKLLESAGVAVSDVELLDLPDASLPAAFASGVVDLAWISEPWISRIEREGHATVWRPARDIKPDFDFGYLLFGPNLLSKNPDAGRRFMVAYLKGVRRFNEGKTRRNIEILAKYTGLEPKLVESACWTPFREDGRIDVNSVLEFQRWALANALVDKPMTAEEFWDPRFVEYANDVLAADTR